MNCQPFSGPRNRNSKATKKRKKSSVHTSSFCKDLGFGPKIQNGSVCASARVCVCMFVCGHQHAPLVTVGGWEVEEGMGGGGNTGREEGGGRQGGQVPPAAGP